MHDDLTLRSAPQEGSTFTLWLRTAGGAPQRTADQRPVFNRTVRLRDTWAKVKGV